MKTLEEIEQRYLLLLETLKMIPKENKNKILAISAALRELDWVLE